MKLMLLIMLTAIVTSSVAGDGMFATVDDIEVALELPSSENNLKNSEDGFIQLHPAFLWII